MYCVHTKVQSAAVQIEDELILATQLASSRPPSGRKRHRSTPGWGATRFNTYHGVTVIAVQRMVVRNTSRGASNPTCVPVDP